MKVKTRIKSGGISHNHNRTNLRIKTRVKCGALSANHNRTR